MAYEFKDGLEYAKSLDKQDKLSHLRQRFHVNDDEIYMDGNSLGLSSRDAEDALNKMFQVWREEAIRIWVADEGQYFNYSKKLSRK